MLSTNTVVKNSLISLIAQISSMLLSFVVRSLFLKYLGLEMQGLNSVVGETLGFLSLAELGIGSAITFRLYKPLVEGDEELIGSLMRVYQVAYRVTALIVFGVGLIMMAFLPFLIKEQTINYDFIRLVYLIQLITSATSYLFAYKRSLLYADQRQYICKSIDLFMNLLFSVLRIISMVLFKSFIIYLILQLLQSIISNVFVSLKCNQLYPYLVGKNAKKYEHIRDIFVDTKDILFGKIAGYVWSSTDSIVVSIFTGLTAVGGMSNYKFVINAVKNLLHSITEPIGATIGNFLQVKEKEDSFKMLQSYIFFRFVMIDIAATGLIVCADTFVGVFFGEQYVLEKIISILIVTDIFIGVIYGPLGEVINLLGYFKEEKIISILGAVTNLGSSIILVQIMGMKGVLYGTCISQIVFLIGDSIILFKKYFKSGKKMIQLWKRYVVYAFIMIIQTIIIELGVNQIFGKNYTLSVFVVEVIMCVIISVLVVFIVFRKTREYEYLINLLKKFVSVKVKNKIEK